MSTYLLLVLLLQSCYKFVLRTHELRHLILVLLHQGLKQMIGEGKVDDVFPHG